MPPRPTSTTTVCAPAGRAAATATTNEHAGANGFTAFHDTASAVPASSLDGDGNAPSGGRSAWTTGWREIGRPLVHQEPSALEQV